DRCQKRGELRVALRGEKGEEVVELNQEAHVGGAPPREVAAAQPVDALAVDHDRSRGRRVEPADQVQQRRLARPRRPHQRDEVATRNVEVDAVQNLDRLAAAPIRLGDAANLDEDVYLVVTRTAALSFTRCG